MTEHDSRIGTWKALPVRMTPGGPLSRLMSAAGNDGAPDDAGR